MITKVVSLDKVPFGPGQQAWDVASVHLLPSTVVNSKDVRVESQAVIAVDNGTLLGVLPIYRLRRGDFPSPIFDPRHVAPDIFGQVGHGPERFLLVGGYSDLVSGCAVSATASSTRRFETRIALTRGALEHARVRMLTPVGLYVRNEDRDAYLAAWQPAMSAEIAQSATLAVKGASDEDYAASLSSGRRSIVRRDWTRFKRSGLRAAEADPLAVIDEAVEYVCEVKRRHGIADHPRLVRVRLHRWCDLNCDDNIAFVVRDESDSMIGVSFGCRYQSMVEMYEIGLHPTDDCRHLAYVEVLVYGPMRYAQKLGCRQIMLGLDSPRPKFLRGATLSPVSSIGVAN